MKRPLLFLGLVMLAVAWLCGAASPPPAAALSFAPPGFLGVGARPYAVAAGDLNGDGHADIVSANYSGDTVTVLLGNGRGGFVAAPLSPVAVGDGPAWVTIANLNGDTHPDLAVTNWNNTPTGNCVSILLNDGSGGFVAQPVAPAVGTSPRNVDVGDFNGDAKADLATSDSGSGTVSVLLGAGDGTFAAAGGSPYATGANPFCVAAADLDGDGQLDLAATSGSGAAVVVLTGNGDGTFDAALPFVTGPGPTGLVAADLNGDAKIDLASCNNQGNTVSVLLNTTILVGTPTFAAKADSFAMPGPWLMAAADLDGDGALDLITAGNSAFFVDVVSVLRGDGLGGFGPPLTFAAGYGPYGMAAADFNGGQRDLVVADYMAGYDSIAVLFNRTRSTVTAVKPARGRPGVTVTITGTGFGEVRGRARVYFGGKAATKYLSWSQTQIKVKVPATAAGRKALTVRTVEGKSNAKSFKVL